MRKEVGLSYLPTPDFLEFRLPPGYIALVTNEGTALTSAVCKALQAQGNEVVVLNLHPSLKVQTGLPAISLRDNSVNAVESAIAQLEQQHGKVGSFIHLHPHLEFVKPNFAQHFEIEKHLLQSVFLLAKVLKPALNELAEFNRANFLTVSRLDGQLGLGKRGNISILGGGLPGLVKSLHQEWPQVFCRAVDLQPELYTDRLAELIIAELHDANTTITEVGVNEKGRSTIRARGATNEPSNQFTARVNADSVFLVSGGARGVTATCVIEMAKTFQCKFILLGRSNNTFTIPAFAKAAYKADGSIDENALKRFTSSKEGFSPFDLRSSIMERF
ncbi:MAG: beta-ketoacyl synthase, partial [Bacteroidota bacterium]